MPADRVVHYKGVTISVWEQTISVSGFPNLWLRRPVEDRDIEGVKGIIDAARHGLAQEIRALQRQTDELIAS